MYLMQFILPKAMLCYTYGAMAMALRDKVCTFQLISRKLQENEENLGEEGSRLKFYCADPSVGGLVYIFLLPRFQCHWWINRGESDTCPSLVHFLSFL